MITADATVGPRGRLVIPAEVRRESGIEEGQVVVLMSEGPGRVMVTTRKTIQDEVWAAAPPPDGVDAVTYVRRMRQEDDRREADRTSVSNAPDDTDKGASLLREFGLPED